MKKYKFLVFVYFITSLTLSSQNTIGTIINSENSYDAYTLFTTGKETFLINNAVCKVHYEYCSNLMTRRSIHGAVLTACQEAWSKARIEIWPEEVA